MYPSLAFWVKSSAGTFTQWYGRSITGAVVFLGSSVGLSIPLLGEGEISPGRDVRCLPVCLQ